jgi:hypothetical protein
VTPGRLELHESALVGVQLHLASVFGSYRFDGHYAASTASEYDVEQDLFGAVRVLGRGQVAALVPLVETIRSSPPDGYAEGGGVGDINLAARYDFVVAGESRVVPGVALLAGLTLPTGTPVESAHAAVDATGIGAFQASGALALEQTFGPWLVNATAIVAARTPRFGETLGPQTTLLAAGAYTFPNDLTTAVAVSYQFVPDAADAHGASVPFSSTRLTTVTLTGLYPVGDAWRLIAGAFVNPPVSGLGSNQPAGGGFLFTAVRSWR